MRASHAKFARSRLHFGAVAILSVLWNCSLTAAPVLNDNTVLLTLDADSQRMSREFAQLRTRRANPSEALAVAKEFVANGRERQDERYFGYALAMLQSWPNDATAPIDVVLVRADITQHQHRFQQALAMLDTVVQRDPHNTRAVLMRATLWMAQGQPQRALLDCRRLLAQREIFIGTVCVSQARSLNGEVESGYRLLQTVLRSPSSNAEYGWALGIAADMADRRGELDTAIRLLREACEVAPRDLPLALQLADALLEKKEYEAAVAALAGFFPTEPVLLRRALAEKHLHRAGRALAQWRDSVEQNRRLQLTLHLREVARGQLELLNQPQEALKSAQANWEVQREPADARILLAAAKAVGDKAAINKVRQWQESLRFEDKVLEAL